ncbi:hypothetical protein [Thermosipho sp. (in: thermotogales)]|uniref:hypothetical protein n=1 Tax=Thermosipho sp. (in: thermotogales) TaxID=1968895 RepID=UPI00257AFD42|nr:hypothetical protein [Thermosipho sp. (in: thermotogales)]MBZ4649277.1 hypothetical protein [Thermosipho sp. (in: thermotogales)]
MVEYQTIGFIQSVSYEILEFSNCDVERMIRYNFAKKIAELIVEDIDKLPVKKVVMDDSSRMYKNYSLEITLINKERLEELLKKEQELEQIKSDLNTTKEEYY